MILACAANDFTFTTREENVCGATKEVFTSKKLAWLFHEGIYAT
jgi:hypothetical protein